MRRFGYALTLLFFTLSALAADKEQARPNTLTPKEIADGWILLFDGETTFGWKIEGEAKVENGILTLGTTKDTTATLNIPVSEFELEMESQGEGNAWLDTGNGKVSAGVGPGGGWASWKARTDGKGLGKAGVTVRTTVPAAGKLVTESIFTSEAGRNTFSLQVSPGDHLGLHSIKFRPLGLKPIFNGKDLTGWKEIPGHKSKFTVSDKGELNIKDGNGDIQTDAQWGDFVLQLDVFSNGPHLNSGVFFRCSPGQFWSGYEAQIRNQWEGDDRTKPVDYGTGGIYNRQPARKVVSSDHEWFTMTIAAHGNHLAVWVNGYQTADYTDTRPPNPSARKGSKVDKGPISLQGHDPTTDLSFRNIRIAELPKAK